MANILDQLGQLGADFNAPLKADPNLNTAALLFGAGLLQPVPAGGTSAGVAGQALASSVGYLSKTRAEQTKLAQEKQLKEREIGAFEGRTAAGVEGVKARSAQDERQFQTQREQSRLQHEERMKAAQAQLQATLLDKNLDKAKLHISIDQNIDKYYTSALEANPDIFAQRRADGKPIVGTIDHEALSYVRTRDKNRARQAAGLEVTGFIPFSESVVKRAAEAAIKNPSNYLRDMQEAAIVYGPKFAAAVADRIQKAPREPEQPAGSTTAGSGTPPSAVRGRAMRPSPFPSSMPPAPRTLFLNRNETP